MKVPERGGRAGRFCLDLHDSYADFTTQKRILETRLHALCSDLLQLDEWMQLVNQAKRHALFCSVEGSAESCDGLANERKARAAASMGLRIVSEQAAQLAKQGSMIPHLYPERQLSRLPETPPPLGMSSIDMCSVLSYINQTRFCFAFFLFVSLPIFPLTDIITYRYR